MCPNFDFDPVLGAEMEQIPGRRLLSRWLSIQEDNDMGLAKALQSNESIQSAAEVRSAAGSIANVSLINLKQGFCPGGNLCLYRSETRSYYRDPQHLSVDGALFALRTAGLPQKLDLSGR